MWFIYYGDGSVFSHEDGSPFDAPRTDVQVIVQQNPESPSGWCLTFGRRWYYWNAGWWPDDELAEWLKDCPPGQLQILRGKNCPHFEGIKKKAIAHKMALIGSAV